jgi:hypothetical protein
MSGSIPPDVFLRPRLGAAASQRRQRKFIGSDVYVYFDVVSSLTGALVPGATGLAAWYWLDATEGDDSPAQPVELVEITPGTLRMLVHGTTPGTYTAKADVETPSSQAATLTFDVLDDGTIEFVGTSQVPWNDVLAAGAGAGAAAGRAEGRIVAGTVAGETVPGLVDAAVAPYVEQAAGSKDAAEAARDTAVEKAGQTAEDRTVTEQLAGEAIGSVIQRTTYTPNDLPDAPARPSSLKLRERISVTDYASLRDGENWRPAFMAAIDETPDGWEILVPASTQPYWVDWIDLCGSNQSQVDGTILRGQGMARSVIRKFGHYDIPTALGRKKSPIEALFGRGHGLIDLAIYSNGETAPTIPYTTNWNPGQVFTYSVSSKRIVSTAPDGSYASIRTAADRIFVLAASHTANASSILPDLAAGRWVEVTGQVYDDMTGGGYFNSYTLDADYAFRHGVYMNGTLEPMRDTFLHRVLVSQSTYGGFVQGSGPLFADNKGFGTQDAVSVDCRAEDCRASSWGGGNAVGRRIINPTGINPGSSCIKLDEGSHRAYVSGARFKARDATTNPRGASPEGIQIYKSDDAVITGCVLDGFTVNFTASSSDHIHLDNNLAINGTGGFKIGGGSGHYFGAGNKAVDITGRGLIFDEVLYPALLAGEAVNCTGVGATLTGVRYGRISVVARGCGSASDGDGIRLESCRHVVVDAPRAYDNGKAGSALSAGIRLVDCYDCEVRSPAAANLVTTGANRSQSYGLVEEGAASARNRFVNITASQNVTAATAFTAGAAVENPTATVQSKSVPDDYTFTVGGRFSVAGKTLRLPLRNTANRPASPLGGDLGYNTDNSRIEIYASGAYASLLTTAGNLTMTGLFTLAGDATAAMHPVTKQQLDAVSVVASAGGSAAAAAANAQATADAALPRAGGVSMTGLFSLVGPGTAGNQPVTKTQLDGVNATATGAASTANAALPKAGGIMLGPVETLPGAITTRRQINGIVGWANTTGAASAGLNIAGDGVLPLYTLANISAVDFSATVVARAASSGSVASWEVAGLIARGADAASTVLVGSTVTPRFSNGLPGTSVSVSADTANGGLVITVTGITGTVNWMVGMSGERQG